MNTYSFETTATMKDYNYKKYWIDSDIVNRLTIKSENIESAIKSYQTIVNDRFGVNISNNAIKNKSAIYNNEAEQVGYVFTAKTFFEDRDNYKTTIQYIDLWVTISIVSKPIF